MASTHQMALYLAAVVLLLAASTVQGSGENETLPGDSRQINDVQDTTIEQFPWQVSVECADHVCGGSVLSTRWVLTAARCGCPVGLPRVRYGTSLGDRGGGVNYVWREITHELYKPNATSDYDVALLEMEEEFTWDDQTKPVRGLATVDPTVGKDVVVTGWGFTNYTADTPKTLQKMELFVQDWYQCMITIDPLAPGEVTQRKLCALPVGNRGTCFADRGDPLIEKETGVLVGVATSMSYDCAHGLPILYTSVARIREWIRENTDI